MKELVKYIHELENEILTLHRRVDNAIAFAQCIMMENEELMRKKK
jgi:hypothetical protein